MKRVRFTKYQGAGNDFILLDVRHDAPGLTRPEIRALCDRRFGIGADGLMTLETSTVSGCDFRMRYYNADGGESTMCGNGGRCIVRFADHLGVGGRVKRFDSSDGIHTAELLGDRLVRLQMIDTGTPEPLADGRSWFLFTGSPHYVEFTDRLETLDVERLGAAIRQRADFEAIGGTNVNFVEVAGEGRIRVRTFERGVEAETWACGTGVTAAALVTHAVRQPECFDFTVETRGGVLGVTFVGTEAGTFADIRLTGPAERVFAGEINI